ncbi:MAG: NAD(P)/FAD-dependent oxidoreductase [Bacteroidota bacterium]|jgi:D-amino-acid dehydrogenase|nr:FAD-dependent oxidoreductase [Cytophagales bacterium]MCE2957099.1 FAD-dependent oxidoreductase [Flammeovirgaceae bacterium]
MKIGILGGGIIGLSSAYYLNKAGYDVTIIDQTNLLDGCSHGNAGMIVPSHFIPLAAPGMISKGIRWMFDSTSPFYIKPRFSKSLIKWGYHFYRSATSAHVQKSAPALKEISLLSKSLYQEWKQELPFDFGYQEKGLLMLFKTKEAEHEEANTVEMASRYGIEAYLLNASEVQNLETQIKVDVKGGVYFPGDAHLNPNVLVTNLIKFLRQKGVSFRDKTTLKDFQIDNGKVLAVKTNNGDFRFDEVVMALGSWSGEIGGKLQLSLPMQAGKGYSFTLNDAVNNVQIPSIFLEARVAVTPMGNSLRFGGTMEITGVDHRINMNRVKGIVNAIPRYYPKMLVPMPNQENVWHGLRPCSPDGLPYIGRSKKIENLIIATGHSMMGLSLAPATGLLVSELVDNKKSSMNIELFEPERF